MHIARGEGERVPASEARVEGQRLAAGGQKAQVARDMGISRETVYQYLRLKT